MSYVLCIRPQDNTTKFLERIPNALENTFQEIVKYINIEPSDQAHVTCYDEILRVPEDGFIIFLGHGTREYLQGAVIRGFSNAGYAKREFINSDNIDIFKDKKVFCLSCYSSDKLGDIAIEKGAKTFVGFGEIPTELSEFEEEQEQPLKRIISDFKGIIQETVRESLIFALHNDLSINQMILHLKLLLNKKHGDVIINHKGKRDRRELGEFIYKMKKQIKVFGNGDFKVIG
ncbi:MAG: hypothetical protein H8D45_16165 [Bacteroidetes bacterium]|nr:hypothetical protein [Bacteroidota bacterium]MBL7103164.1 hypothetical protein [Bacteroidales bacterium]